MTAERRIGDGGPILAVAHRGDPIGFRENTIPAVQAAIDAGADIIEIDVKTTRDGVSVVLHDDQLTRLWGDDRSVAQLSTADLPAIGAPQRIPLLAEVLTVVGRSAAAVMIDVNSKGCAAVAQDAVHDALGTAQLRRTQVLWCGDQEGLAQVRARDRHARIVLSWGEEALHGPPGDALVEQLRPEAFNPHWRALDGAGRDWARSKGLPVCTWTVDDPVLMRRVIDEGVDAVITNRVADLVELTRGPGART